jgi:lysophospholipid acyltransferase (LPLAT)-like uncharacterized protein
MTADSHSQGLRVDNVPLWLRPAFHTFGYGGGAALEALLALIRATCTMQRVAMHDGARIECLWHEHLPAYMAAYLPAREGRRYVWMNHPIWYMRPVHVVLGWSGVERLYLGSSGHGGQAALDGVVAALGEGCFSTALAVDGPAGPPHKAKRGALDMALRSGLPIVPISFRYERARRAGGWDHKWWPRPGSHILIHEHEPLSVTAANLEMQHARLEAALSGY